MNMNEISKIALNLSIDPGSMNKIELIRCIQEKEGHRSCFKTNHSSCHQYECCWRGDCQPGALIALSQVPVFFLTAASRATTV